MTRGATSSARSFDAFERIVHPRGRILVEAVVVRPRERAPAVGQREQGEPFGVAQAATESLTFALTGSCGSVSGRGAPNPPPRGRSSA